MNLKNTSAADLKSDACPDGRLQQTLLRDVELVAKRLGQLDNGLRTLQDWVGQGGVPVSAELAQNRADVCTGRTSGNPCPYNDSGLKPIKFVAEIIRSHVAVKNKLELSVAGGESLKTCGLCFCYLPLKVFVPLKTLAARTEPGLLEQLRKEKPDCWLVKEIDENESDRGIAVP